MLLTSSLKKGNIAYDKQTLTFRCTIRGTGTNLSWISDDYIGSGGSVLLFVSIDSPGLRVMSSTDPNTVATLINVTTDVDTRVTKMVSELQITASVVYPNSSVGCQVNDNGPLNTTIFWTTLLSKQTTH